MNLLAVFKNWCILFYLCLPSSLHAHWSSHTFWLTSQCVLQDSNRGRKWVRQSNLVIWKEHRPRGLIWMERWNVALNWCWMEQQEKLLSSRQNKLRTRLFLQRHLQACLTFQKCVCVSLQLFHKCPCVSGYFSSSMWPCGWAAEMAVIHRSCISNASIWHQGHIVVSRMCYVKHL